MSDLYIVFCLIDYFPHCLDGPLYTSITFMIVRTCSVMMCAKFVAKVVKFLRPEAGSVICNDSISKTKSSSVVVDPCCNSTGCLGC